MGSSKSQCQVRISWIEKKQVKPKEASGVEPGTLGTPRCRLPEPVPASCGLMLREMAVFSVQLGLLCFSIVNSLIHSWCQNYIEFWN